MQKIGLRLKRVRKQKGISQKELAEKIHVRRQTVSSYERGISTPDVYILIAIADYFDISMDELVGRRRGEKKKISLYKNKAKKYIEEDGMIM